MKRFAPATVVFVLLVASTAFAFAQAPEGTAAPAAPPEQPVPVAAGSAEPAAAPTPGAKPVEMVTYILGVLKKGRNWTSDDTPEVRRIQQGHMAHIKRMSESGKLVLAGPLTDDDEIRGLLVFKDLTIEAARQMGENDPAVRAGRLYLEVHPWMVQKGILP